jgi:hypothetical protein
MQPLKMEDLETVNGGMSRRTLLMMEMASMNMNSTLMQLQSNPSQNNMMMAMAFSAMMGQPLMMA